ncbi:hypothetical protein ACIBBE_48920, partial [Streptomyces sp. NPDC051644]
MGFVDSGASAGSVGFVDSGESAPHLLAGRAPESAGPLVAAGSRDDAASGSPAGPLSPPPRSWDEVFGELRATLDLRLAHEWDLQRVLARSAHDFHTILGHPDSPAHHYKVDDRTIKRTGNDFRKETITRHDKIWAPSFEHDTEAWLNHERRHENAFDEALTTARTTPPDPDTNHPTTPNTPGAEEGAGPLPAGHSGAGDGGTVRQTLDQAQLPTDATAPPARITTVSEPASGMPHTLTTTLTTGGEIGARHPESDQQLLQQPAAPDPVRTDDLVRMPTLRDTRPDETFGTTRSPEEPGRVDVAHDDRQVRATESASEDGDAGGKESRSASSLRNEANDRPTAPAGRTRMDDWASLRADVGSELTRLGWQGGPVTEATVRSMAEALSPSLLNQPTRAVGVEIAQRIANGGQPIRARGAGHGRGDSLSADELIQRLNVMADQRVPDVRRLRQKPGPLGVDLFGVLKPEPVPYMLRDPRTGVPYDYTGLDADRSVHFLHVMDMRYSAPAEMDPGTWEVSGFSYEHRRSSLQWSPDPRAPRLPSLDVRVPALVHAIWLGGPLLEHGASAGFWKRYGGAARNLGGGAVFVLWTDVPREKIEQVSEAREAPADPLLADVWRMVSWATSNGVRLVNTHEVYNASRPMELHTEFLTETAKQSGAGWAAASDILRLEILDVFGGLYNDGDNDILNLDALAHVTTSAEGFAITADSNSGIATHAAHPFVRQAKRFLRENYRKTQTRLYPVSTVKFPPTFWSRGMGRARRYSVMLRTGPNAYLDVAKSLSYQGLVDLPRIPGITTRSDLSWQTAPERSTRTWSHQETVDFTVRVVHTLVRGLYNRNGDLHLTYIADAVSRHRRPDLVWDAALGFLASRDDLRPLVLSVTAVRQLAEGFPDAVVRLPPAAEALLRPATGQEAGVAIGDSEGWWLGERSRPVRLVTRAAAGTFRSGGSRSGQSTEPLRGGASRPETVSLDSADGAGPSYGWSEMIGRRRTASQLRDLPVLHEVGEGSELASMSADLVAEAISILQVFNHYPPVIGHEPAEVWTREEQHQALEQVASALRDAGPEAAEDAAHQIAVRRDAPWRHTERLLGGGPPPLSDTARVLGVSVGPPAELAEEGRHQEDERTRQDSPADPETIEAALADHTTAVGTLAHAQTALETAEQRYRNHGEGSSAGVTEPGEAEGALTAAENAVQETRDTLLKLGIDLDGLRIDEADLLARPRLPGGVLNAEEKQTYEADLVKAINSYYGNFENLGSLPVRGYKEGDFKLGNWFKSFKTRGLRNLSDTVQEALEGAGIVFEED